MLLHIEQLTEVVTEVSLPCNKCNGSGYLQQHRRISGGVCFKCDGRGDSNKTKNVTNYKTESYAVNAEILEDGDTFEAMLERRQATKAKQDEVLKKMESGEMSIFDWFDAA